MFDASWSFDDSVNSFCRSRELEQRKYRNQKKKKKKKKHLKQSKKQNEKKNIL